jgi:hypothetical protein
MDVPNIPIEWEHYFHEWLKYWRLVIYIFSNVPLPFPWLFTNAALGGLKPAPASRLRGAIPSSSVQLRTLYVKVRSWRTLLEIYDIALTDRAVMCSDGLYGVVPLRYQSG